MDNVTCTEIARHIMSGEWLPIVYAAALYGVSTSTISTWAKDGRVQSKKIGYIFYRLYNLDDIAKCIAENSRHSYHKEVAEKLTSGEWLNLQFVSALVSRAPGTVVKWKKKGYVRTIDFGSYKTNLYNVSDALEAADRERKCKRRKALTEANVANRLKHYHKLWESLMDESPLCWNFSECHNPAVELAHIVANTKANHVRYGWWSINHHDNVKASCKECNAKAMGLVRGDAERLRHIEAIRSKLQADGIDVHTGDKK